MLKIPYQRPIFHAFPNFVHSLSKRSVDTTLGGDSVRSGWEKLGDTSSVETSLCKTEGSSQTSTSSSNNDSIIFVVDDWVLV